jgi:hypothetical protein
MIHHTTQGVLHKDSQTVGIFHYEPGRPEFISQIYMRNVPESIIDYSDALRFKFKCAGIHDTQGGDGNPTQTHGHGSNDNDQKKFSSVGLKGINTSTVKILREETIRSLAH